MQSAALMCPRRSALGRRGALLALLGTIAVLAGCAPTAPSAPPRLAGPPAAPASTDAAAPPPQTRLRVAYATPSGGFAAPWMAQEAGLFARYGLDVDLQYIASGPSLLQSMLAGETQFGELAAPAAMNAYVAGGDIVWLTGTVNRPVLLVVARPEIEQLSDLRGRSVGVTRIGTTTHIFMKLALRAAGLAPERDVQILQTGGTPETVAALQSGAIYAGVAGPPTHLRALEAGMHVLADLAELGIAWPFAGSVTTRRYLAEQPAIVRRYLQAYLEGLYLLRTDRERAIQVIAQYTHVDRDIAAQTWELFRDRYAWPPYPNVEAMTTVVEEDLALTDPRVREIPPTAFFDDHLLRDLVASGFLQQLAAPLEAPR
ncbi:MAG TPA: ABC transporter substrate-binding protein [Chloroflexota bacterium]|nr:ABC transporter substrate-binding protein [Chloroflexota bacterium]